ncbi:MAG: hypothetical protein HEQ35_03250 [Gloeotrichia echinulata IR180]
MINVGCVSDRVTHRILATIRCRTLSVNAPYKIRDRTSRSAIAFLVRIERAIALQYQAIARNIEIRSVPYFQLTHPTIGGDRTNAPYNRRRSHC